MRHMSSLSPQIFKLSKSLDSIFSKPRFDAEKKLPRKTVLVTGCSTGIGKSLAEAFIKTGKYNVAITARKKSLHILRHNFTDDEFTTIHPLDITSDEDIETTTYEIFKKWKKIDILINNAGIAYRSVFEHMDEESEYHQLKTNYLGPMSLIRAVLPSMRENKSGHIINISSVSGMVAMPTMGSYSASKAALDSATKALWYETKPFGIKVSIVQPGFVHSESFKNVYLPPKARLSLALDGPYSEYYQSLSPFIAKFMGYSNMTPEKIASRVLKITELKYPPLTIPVTFDALVFETLTRLLPTRLFHALMFKMLPNSKYWIKKNASIKSYLLPFTGEIENH